MKQQIIDNLHRLNSDRLRIQSNIQDGVFFKNRRDLKAFIYFYKKSHPILYIWLSRIRPLYLLSNVPYTQKQEREMLKIEVFAFLIILSHLNKYCVRF